MGHAGYFFAGGHIPHDGKIFIPLHIASELNVTVNSVIMVMRVTS
jgi:hypothetical protein